jgi:hypothetical protein
MTVTSIDLNPAVFTVLSSETLPFTVEWVDLIGVGSTVTTPSAKIYDDANGIQVTNGFVNNYGANGTQAQYIIDGTKLQPEHTYTAIVQVNVGSQIFKQRVSIVVTQ